MADFISSDFDIFAPRPVQSAVLDTRDTQYHPLAPVTENDLEFLVPGEQDAYIDNNVRLYAKGKLVNDKGEDYADTDFSSVVNNLLHSLFSQCSVSLNGVSITRSKDMYNYRSYFETLLTYGFDATFSHLTNRLWQLDSGDMKGCDPTAAKTDNTNNGFVARWQRTKQSKVIELYGRLHGDLFNVPQLLLPGVTMQIRLTRAKDAFYILAHSKDSTARFLLQDARLFVRKVRPNPSILLAHSNALGRGCIARYNMTRVDIKTFTFSAGSRSLSIDNAVLGTLPKRLLFAIVKNDEFLGTVDSNPYNLRHYNMTHFVLYVNGRQIPSEGGLRLDMSHEKTSVMGYNTLFEGSGIHHGDSGLMLTHDMYIAGYFMLLFDLTPDLSASEGHMSLPENGSIRIEMAFGKALPEAVTCILYLEYDGCVRIDKSRTVTTDY